MRVVVVVVSADDARPWQPRPASPIVPPLHACVCRPLRRIRSVKPRRGRDDSISNQLSSHPGRLRIPPSRDGRGDRGVRGGREDESADGPGGPRFVYPQLDFQSSTSTSESAAAGCAADGSGQHLAVVAAGSGGCRWVPAGSTHTKRVRMSPSGVAGLLTSFSFQLWSKHTRRRTTAIMELWWWHQTEITNCAGNSLETGEMPQNKGKSKSDFLKIYSFLIFWNIGILWQNSRPQFSNDKLIKCCGESFPQQNMRDAVQSERGVAFMLSWHIYMAGIKARIWEYWGRTGLQSWRCVSCDCSHACFHTFSPSPPLGG